MRSHGHLGFTLDAAEIKNDILVPRYYDPDIDAKLKTLTKSHLLFSLAEMEASGWIALSHGKYIPKALYGSGDIPYVRTSDIANWELKGSPKHGIDAEVYNELASIQDVQVDDILLVHEGTYLIGVPCLVTRFDTRILYQHHLAKIRVQKEAPFSASVLLAGLLSPVAQAQIRARQFTADVIDSIVGRLPEVVVPIPSDPKRRDRLATTSEQVFTERAAARVRLAVLARGLDDALRSGHQELMADVNSAAEDEGLQAVVSFLGARVPAVTFTASSNRIENDVLVPRYYDPNIESDLTAFEATCDLMSVDELIADGMLSLSTGVEVGKLAYGGGDIPFIRTSDFGNWELKHDPKQLVSREVYDDFMSSASVEAGDILLVRDGTYLVGTSVMVVEDDLPMIYSGGIYRIRCLEIEALPPPLLLALLNTTIVRRQIKSKQFTRDVIDTLGHRLREVVLPLPRSDDLKSWVTETFGGEIDHRTALRRSASQLGRQCEAVNEQPAS